MKRSRAAMTGRRLTAMELFDLNQHLCFTQEFLAEMVGVSTATLNRWLNEWTAEPRCNNGGACPVCDGANLGCQDCKPCLLAGDDQLQYQLDHARRARV